MAGIGPSLPLSEYPNGICLLAIEESDGVYAEICSGVVIDSRHILTAGHCAANLTQNSIVKCRAETSRVNSVDFAEKFHIDNLNRDIRFRKDDLAIIETESALTIPAVDVVTTENGIKTIIGSESLCAFFGFSKLLNTKLVETLPAVEAIEFESEMLTFQDGLLILDGKMGRSALVEPGDSGGGIACLQNQQWRFIGVVSGRDWEYRSFFAPTSHHQGLLRRQPYLPQQVIPGRDAQRASFDIIESFKYRVKPYSLITKTNTTEISEFTNHVDLIAWNSTHSTLDHKYIEFIAKEKIGDDKWIGDLLIHSWSEYYTCTAGFLCSNGSMTNVIIASKDLEEPK